MSILNWLIEWYSSQCDGDWEHCYGVKIYTADNPGWCVDIDILGTSVEGKEFSLFQYDNGDADWIICKVKDGRFIGAGDSSKLEEIIQIFKEWVEQ